jgi:hypothetical protein
VGGENVASPTEASERVAMSEAECGYAMASKIQRTIIRGLAASKGMTPARRPPSTVEVDSGCDLSFDAVSVDLHHREKRLTTAWQRPPPLVLGVSSCNRPG